MSGADQRDYYRIDERASVEYKLVTSDEPYRGPAANHFDLPAGFELLKELYLLDLESREILRKINRESLELGHFLGNLNKRIDILGQIIIEDTSHSALDSVNLSNGGLAFRSETLLEKDLAIALKLTFDPAYLGITCYGLVRHCRLDESSHHYLIGVQFLALDQADDTILSRYILHHQAEDRRQRLREANYE